MSFDKEYTTNIFRIAEHLLQRMCFLRKSHGLVGTSASDKFPFINLTLSILINISRTIEFAAVTLLDSFYICNNNRTVIKTKFDLDHNKKKKKKMKQFIT